MHNLYYMKGSANEMGNKGLDFKHKEVINITDGKRLGFVILLYMERADYK